VRAVVIVKHGGIDVLQVQERPEPPLGPGRVRIDVRAAGVNFADTLARVGLYPDAPKPPCVVGYEVAGTIGAVGDGVDAGRVGQRVMVATAFGGYASQVVVPEADVIVLPERLSFEEGAAVPVVYATGWASLYGFGSLRAGERVLVHAAAGGVGIAVLQLARRGGAEVHGTASPGKHARLRQLGLDRAIDYRRDGWWRDLPAYDLVIDGIGGASFRRSNALLRAGGRLVGLGASSVQEGETRNLRRALPQALRMMRGFDLLKQMGDSKSFVGLNMKRLWDDRGTLGPWIEPLSAFLDDGTIAPVVHAAVPFDRAGEAHRILAARENVGKVVLVP
jgi:NADPH:quinone reductase-like Zn-dependent oxidoreductase